MGNGSNKFFRFFIPILLSVFFLLIKVQGVHAQTACQGLVKCLLQDPVYGTCTSTQVSGGGGCGPGSSSSAACSALDQTLNESCGLNTCAVGGCYWNPLFLPTPTPGGGGGGGGGGSCTRSPWANTSCDGGTCNANQMQQVRTVNPAGCDITSQCIPDGSCPPSTPPPGCTTSVWVNTACDAGTCTANQMQQVRTVSPAGCASTSQCVANPGCSAGIPTPTPAPTCTISLSPSTLNLTLGGSTGTITATVSCSASVDSVTFTSGNTSIATVSPGTDSTSPYTTIVTAVAPGATIITGVVNSGGQPRASDTTTVNSTPPAAWWQVKDGDVTTGGDLTSSVPSGIHFDKTGDGGYPGIPSYEGSTNLTSSSVSAEGWITKNTIVNPKVYDYSTLINLIPVDISSNFNILNVGDNIPAELMSAGASHDANNYYWFMYDGATNGGQPLTLPAVNVGSRKVILLVKSANLNITGNVTLTNGVGFFMTAVDGNISVASSVGGGGGANLEGIYMADGTFSDGVGATQLQVRGSVVAYGGVNLQRDLLAGNVTDPGEYFIYAPDQILLYPSKLGVRKIHWKEVAP